MPSTGLPKTALVIVDNPERRANFGEALQRLGVAPFFLYPEGNPFAQILDTRPDFLVLEEDLPNIGYLTPLEEIRRHPELEASSILVLAEDQSPEHRARVFQQGADECVSHACPPEELEQVLRLAPRFELAFWGIRGTLPVPGNRTLKYGGNTSCVSLSVGHGRQFLFDAGTGLRNLSNRIMETTGGRFHGRLFISHPHWDHFNSLPFFQPLYQPGNHIIIHGPAQGDRSLRDLIDDQMDGIFFPITVAEFEARVEYQDITEGVHRFDGVRLTAKRLQHPGHCLAYRVDHRGSSFAYVTDNELGARDTDDPDMRELIAFLKDVDVLIHDCTYFDDEYPKKVNWGHSSIGQATRLAHEAGARYFYLFHHDPDHSDEDVERKLETAERRLAELGSRTRCLIAVEGGSIRVDSLKR
jgi:phosphoribosyl 1,2-cyclic phosphodiesterase/CheY-like chemotaxis protein